jgi:hypothetical protein
LGDAVGEMAKLANRLAKLVARNLATVSLVMASP